MSVASAQKAAVVGREIAALLEEFDSLEDERDALLSVLRDFVDMADRVRSLAYPEGQGPVS